MKLQWCCDVSDLADQLQRLISCSCVSSLMATQRFFLAPGSTNESFGTACKMADQNYFWFKRRSRSEEISNKRLVMYPVDIAIFLALAQEDDMTILKPAYKALIDWMFFNCKRNTRPIWITEDIGYVGNNSQVWSQFNDNCCPISTLSNEWCKRSNKLWVAVVNCTFLICNTQLLKVSLNNLCSLLTKLLTLYMLAEFPSCFTFIRK